MQRGGAATDPSADVNAKHDQAASRSPRAQECRLRGVLALPVPLQRANERRVEWDLGPLPHVPAARDIFFVAQRIGSGSIKVPYMRSNPRRLPGQWQVEPPSKGNPKLIVRDDRLGRSKKVCEEKNAG